MSPDELVEALYRALLGRDPDPPGFAFWTERIKCSGDPTVFIRGILECEEYTKRKWRTPLVPPVRPRPATDRVQMTASCRDTDLIPKVTGAGEVFAGPGGVPCQRMHNGIIVVAGGYHGEWMSEVIRRLRGHHEPQEEFLFHSLGPWLAPGRGDPVMVELGAFWSYYSLWFRSMYPAARNIMIEPDPGNLRVGEKNFALNGVSGEFIHAGVGVHNQSARFHCESDGIQRVVKTVSADGLARDLHLERIHLLHADIQGAELAMLAGAEETIRRGGLDWLFLSTHHYSISNDPLTHQRCLEWIEDHSGTIVEEHSVAESFSGDGLIVAKFGEKPQITLPPISRNAPSRSLFRETEYDFAQALAEICRMRSNEPYRP